MMTEYLPETKTLLEYEPNLIEKVTEGSTDSLVKIISGWLLCDEYYIDSEDLFPVLRDLKINSPNSTFSSRVADAMYQLAAGIMDITARMSCLTGEDFDYNEVVADHIIIDVNEMVTRLNDNDELNSFLKESLTSMEEELSESGLSANYDRKKLYLINKSVLAAIIDYYLEVNDFDKLEEKLYTFGSIIGAKNSEKFAAKTALPLQLIDEVCTSE